MTNLTYIEANCYQYTFDAKPVKEFVEECCYGNVANLFAGKNRLVGDFVEYRIDSSNEFNPGFNMLATDFLKQNQKEKMLFDCMIFDPPWNERKSKEFYGGRYIGKFQLIKELMTDVLKLGGRIISCGYEITYFGRDRGFELTDLLIVNPKGEIRPYFVSVEEKVFEGHKLSDWI